MSMTMNVIIKLKKIFMGLSLTSLALFLISGIYAIYMTLSEWLIIFMISFVSIIKYIIINPIVSLATIVLGYFVLYFFYMIGDIYYDRKVNK